MYTISVLRSYVYCVKFEQSSNKNKTSEVSLLFQNFSQFLGTTENGTQVTSASGRASAGPLGRPHQPGGHQRLTRFRYHWLCRSSAQWSDTGRRHQAIVQSDPFSALRSAGRSHEGRGLRRKYAWLRNTISSYHRRTPRTKWQPMLEGRVYKLMLVSSQPTIQQHFISCTVSLSKSLRGASRDLRHPWQNGKFQSAHSYCNHSSAV